MEWIDFGVNIILYGCLWVLFWIFSCKLAKFQERLFNRLDAIEKALQKEQPTRRSQPKFVEKPGTGTTKGSA